MIEANKLVPMEYKNTSNLIKEFFQFTPKETKLHDFNKNLKAGYEEMSQINLAFAEMGLEQDNLDFTMYESVLIGREKL